MSCRQLFSGWFVRQFYLSVASSFHISVPVLELGHDHGLRAGHTAADERHPGVRGDPCFLLALTLSVHGCCPFQFDQLALMRYVGLEGVVVDAQTILFQVMIVPCPGFLEFTCVCLCALRLQTFSPPHYPGKEASVNAAGLRLDAPLPVYALIHPFPPHSLL